MEFRILGPLEAGAADAPVALGGTRQRAVLALLLLQANEVVPADVLIDELWDGQPPATARTALQGYVSRLRQALGPAKEALVTRSPGYLLQVGPGALDSERFEGLLGSARQAGAVGEDAAAAEQLREALGLWRGEALADFRYEPFAQGEIARLEELRLLALESRIDLDLAAGAGAGLVGEVEALVAAHPLRERFRGQLMLALYRAGRQAEALAAYQDARRTLVDELGIEPGPELQRLEREILRQEPGLAPAVPAAAPGRPAAEAAPPREARKTVSVAAFVLSHSAAAGGRLDPEALPPVRARTVEAVSEVVGRHGGTVAGAAGERLIGVFGIPTLHEDDALRALRAAVEANELVPALADELEGTFRARLHLRTGVATGEVVDGGAEPGEAFLDADVVAGALRLAEQAPEGETALAESSRRLVDDAVRVEPLEVPGAEAPAWRLAGLTPGAPAFARRLDAPLVGRRREVAQLREAFARAVRERIPHLVTVLGPAGIGKSRLARELPGLVGDEARVLTGRCLPYGEGITFWPLQEIVQAAAGDAPLESLFGLLGESDEATRVTGLVAAALGLAEATTASEEETSWAVGRLVEALARERPLVLVVEDIHWAEPTFLDLLEYLAGRDCGAPILYVCLARPELFESRPRWAGGLRNATSLSLEPLFPEESGCLLDALLGGTALPAAARGRIMEAAEGNPLFLEQLLALATETAAEEGELPIPPTIEALIAARLDRLGPGERAVLDRASVVGKEFSPQAVVDLLPEEARATAGRHLEALVRKELIRPGRAPGGEEAFRFRHVLIQQVACSGVPKELRARLHERFAAWLVERFAGRLAEVEEIVGYHLERAFRYRDELGPVDAARALAATAAERLGAAGRRAFTRGDAPGAANLLERAAHLLPPDDPGRAELLDVVGEALLESGELGRAEAALAEALAGAEAAGDRRLRARVQLDQAFLTLAYGGEPDEALALAERAIPLFEELRDEAGLARAARLVGEVEWLRGRVSRAAVSWERALVHARAAGDRHEQLEDLFWIAAAQEWGPAPAGDALARLEAVHEEGGGDPRLAAAVAILKSKPTAMEGRFDEARALIVAGRATFLDLGLRVRGTMAPATHLGFVELLAGNPGAAVSVLRSGYEALAEMGEKSYLSTVSANLAEALYEDGRYEEAERFSAESEAAAALDDLVSQVGWRTVRAKLRARDGEADEALRLATEAVALADTTEFVDEQAGAREALACVLEADGLADEAREALAEALELYEAKGNRVAAARTKARLAAASRA
jgi:predicted ATPase/DNA-binding SARP family transcriptional activator